jgi:type VI secretion system protein ImpM
MEVGFYGKLPSHGDFLRRRVDDDFLRIWDEWLQQSMAASRAALGEGWLDVYLTSPAWRFACDAGLFGRKGFAGVVAPSVDRVGRYFPLTVVFEIPEHAQPFMVAQRGEAWFDRIERLILETLAQEHVDLELFDEQLIASATDLELRSWTSAIEVDFRQAAEVAGSTRAQWHVPLGSATSMSVLTEQLLYARLRATHAPLTLLWTEGSARIEPCCLLMSGLPAPASFTAVLNGEWAHEGWHCIDAKVSEAPAHTDTWVSSDHPVRYVSAGLTDTGKTRSVNQDAFIERADIGVWAVADGMGGHEHGEIASRMVCDALADLIPAGTLDATVEAIVERWRRVNGYLHRVATREINPVQSGSTAVALVTRGARCAVVWAGDSRAYRLRDGKLTQLSRDHVFGAEFPGAIESYAITRAVGGEATLDLDVVNDRVRPGDRFLLCSDGLTHEIDDDAIRNILANNPLEACPRKLVEAALSAGGRDNVSVIVIDALPADTV